MIHLPYHPAGFFSCCSLRLTAIVEFIHSNKKLPEVDSSRQFILYTVHPGIDVTFDFFRRYTIDQSFTPIIRYDHEDQFKPYSTLDYMGITPLIHNYFSPSFSVMEMARILEKKYKIISENTIAVYYRGTDKSCETQLGSFDDFYSQIRTIIDKNIGISILVQSDSAPFLDFMKEKLPNLIVIGENKTSYTNQGIHLEQSSEANYYHMLHFFPTILILSKCKYFICSSGNCSIWAMFYRGHAQNVSQYLNGTWHNSIDRNEIHKIDPS